jgi:prepilin-type processing-associated H-X9-DG protein
MINVLQIGGRFNAANVLLCDGLLLTENKSL